MSDHSGDHTGDHTSDGGINDLGDGITVANAPERRRYELRLGDTVIGFTTYRLVGSQRVVFIHTEVDDEYAGRGLAGRLAKFALDDVRAAGKRIVAVCPYIAGYLRRHHEYDDSVDKPVGEGAPPHSIGSES